MSELDPHGERSAAQPADPPVTDIDAMRVALAMIRADWQGDDDEVRALWAVADEPAEVARLLTRLCRENLELLASVGGVSTGEMLHRLAGRLIPHPHPGQVTVIDLTQTARQRAT